MLTYQEPMPCEQLVSTLCDIKQAYTQFGGKIVLRACSKLRPLCLSVTAIALCTYDMEVKASSAHCVLLYLCASFRSLR